MTKPLLALLAIFVLAVGACSSAEADEPVASLEAPDSEAAVDAEADPNAGLFEFAQCMRDEGVEFADPIVEGEGEVTFAEKPTGKAAQEAYSAAWDACSGFLAGTVLGAAKAGDAEAEQLDELYDFAVCMRENGFEIDDPDPTTGDLGELDKESPEFVAAFEACDEVFGSSKDGGSGK